MKAVRGEKVDIITSSHVLAERDAHDYEDIFDLFRVTVGHNCSNSIEDRKKVYSNCQVVYGVLSYFQRDYLLDRFYDKNILGDRTFETVLVDEVDSMLLDKGNNVLYLSRDIPGLDKLEPVLTYIWLQVNKSGGTSSITHIKQNILYELFNQITKDRIRDLDRSLTEKHVSNIWEHLVECGTICRSGNILRLDIGDLRGIPINCKQQDHLKYFLKKVIGREKPFEIPNHLKPFVEAHLDAWLRSAVKAMSMESGRDYVLDVDRSPSSCNRSPNIVIVDRDTGTDLVDSEWDEGLHQFLQLKHGCSLSLISLKTVFISNVSYLKLYRNLYGLTATLGSQQERDLLEDIYKVDFVTILTAKIKSFVEERSIVCSNTDEWLSTIFKNVYRVTSKRSALIICETVNDALTLKRAFEALILEQIYPREINIYIRDYEKLSVPEEGLESGHIIISTNLAGRGTDIKLSEQLIKAGGLHVCLSFLPKNSRIEEQAYGRVARNGEPGTAQLIIKKYPQISTLNIIDLKKQRDKYELLRISDIKKYHETKIHPDEKCFKEFMEVYDRLKNTLREMEHEEDLKSILLQISLDKWAYWLQENSKLKTPILDIDFLNNISKLGDEDFEIWSKQVQDPSHLIKLGLMYLKRKDNRKAILLFDRVINEEPFFSESAYYYRVCAKAAEGDISNIDILNDLGIAVKQIRKRIEMALLSAQAVGRINTHYSKNAIQIDSFGERQMNVSKVYSLFLQSIYTIVGTAITPQSFCIPTIIDELTAYQFYDDLVVNKIIGKLQIKTDITENELSFLQNYNLSSKKMKKMLTKLSLVPEEKFNEKLILNHFKNNLPTRELLWNTLVETGIFTNQKKYVFVDFEKLKFIDPSLIEFIQLLAVYEITNDENRIWLYEPEEMGYLPEIMHQPAFRKDDVKKIGDLRYKVLKKNKVIFKNKHATISNPFDTNVILNYFDCLTNEDFVNLGLPDSVIEGILQELKEKNWIEERVNGNSFAYGLLSNAEDIKHLELSTYKAYTSEVKSLLLFCFAFRIALKTFCESVANRNCDHLWLLFPARFILHELRDREIIRGPFVNNAQDGVKTLQKLYCKSMKKEEYEHIFSEIYDETRRREIVEFLLKKKWLVKKEKLRRLRLVYEINIKKGHNDEIEQTIELILSNHVKRTNILLETLEFIYNVLEKSEGKCQQKEIPSLSLIPLLNVLKENELPLSGCAAFSINGFDELLLVQKKWTWKMIDVFPLLGLIATNRTSLVSVKGFSIFAGRLVLYSAICSALEHVLGKVADILIEMYFKNIEDTLHEHSVFECVKILYRRFGEKDSDHIIQHCFSTTVEEFSDQIKGDWNNMVLITVIIQKIRLGWEKISSLDSHKEKKDSDFNSFIEICVIIKKLIMEVMKCIGHRKNYFKQLSTLVSDILGAVEDKIQNKINQPTKTFFKTSRPSQVDEKQLENLMWKALFHWKESVKQLFSDHIKDDVVPHIVNVIAITTLCLVTQKLMPLLIPMKMLLSNTNLTEDENLINLFPRKVQHNKMRPSFVNSAYDDCLLKLFERKNNVFIDILKESSEVDMKYIQVCNDVLPAALSREGIVIPGLKIVVDRDTQRYNAPTVIITPTTDFPTDHRKQTVLVNDMFNALYKCIVEFYPEFRDMTPEKLRLLVVSHLEQNSDIRNMIDNNCAALTAKRSNGVNALAEERNSYQHTHCDGHWVFNPVVDVDLREEKELLISEVDDHVMRAFNTALEQINSHIYKTQKHLKHPFELRLSDFSETKHEIVPERNNFSKNLFHCYAVEYELIFPFKVKNSNALVDFMVTMRLKNQVNKVQPGCPCGPHILYEMSPLKGFTHIEQGVKGHVLLSKECEEASYSVKECHVAGELILPADKSKY